MGAHAQAFRDVLPILATLLRREARRDSHHHVTGSLSLIRENVEERAPTRVVNALREMVVTHHPADVQVFNADTTIPLGIRLGDLEVEVAPLATDLEMLAGNSAARFAAAMAAWLAAAHRTLPMRQPLLPPAPVARVLHHAAPGKPRSFR